MNGNPEPTVIEMRDVTVGAMRDLKDIVMEGVNWSVTAGEFWVVAGAPYSGKSNFLMMAAGLTSPLSGSYRYFGRELRTSQTDPSMKQQRPGFVFEGGRLFNHLSIAENVAVPLRYHTDLPDDEIDARTQSLLDMVGVGWFAGSLPPNVSVDWLRRAGLARTLTLQPEVLLLDNPLRGLDGHHTQWWLEFLDGLCRGHECLGGAKATVIVTTDDLRPWQNQIRKYALLSERKFAPLGNWKSMIAANHPVAKNLLAKPLAAIIHESEA